MKGNTSKRKLVVALSVIAVVVVAAIVSVVAVLAATTQAVTSSIRVSYSVSDAVATVDARYGFMTVTRTTAGAVDQYTATNNISTLGTAVSFDAADGNDEAGVLNTSELAVNYTSTLSAVVFEFNFTNGATNTIDIALASEPETQTNVTVYYASIVGAAASDDWHTLTWSKTKPTGTTGAATAASDRTDEVHLYVMAVIDDLNKAATYAGEFNWSLSGNAQ